MPELQILIGPSHSGKSTYARQQKDFVVISSDELREKYFIPAGDEEEVWEYVDEYKTQCIEANLNIIIDACNLTKTGRILMLANTPDNYTKKAVIFDIPLETVLERCRNSTKVKPIYCKKMWYVFLRNKPTEEQLKLEGFDEICQITATNVQNVDTNSMKSA